MATTRLEMRINKEVKVKAEKASALLGLKSLTEYVANLIEENATKVIKQHESITVENDIFERFMNSCSKVTSPNKALQDAVIFTKEQGINDL